MSGQSTHSLLAAPPSIHPRSPDDELIRLSISKVLRVEFLLRHALSARTEDGRRVALESAQQLLDQLPMFAPQVP